MAVTIKPINVMGIRFTICSTSPMIQHQWSEKALKQIRDKKSGKKTKNRDVCDPEAEGQAAMYRTEDGMCGIPVLALKASLISAAHKDIGIEKTLVRKSLFFPCKDPGKIIPIQCDEPFIREDYVRVGVSGTDLRYRPEFTSWICQIQAEFDADMLTDKDIISLVNRAGFGTGIGEMRPEKGGEYGRFELDETQPVDVFAL